VNLAAQYAALPPLLPVPIPHDVSKFNFSFVEKGFDSKCSLLLLLLLLLLHFIM
jgi:hypothetical protein